MLISVKQALRVRNNALDFEISDLIEACKKDMEISGIKKIDENDYLIKRGIILYCKANFGLDNKDALKYQDCYESLKCHLALCGDYNVA